MFYGDDLCECSECPVTFISDDSQALVDLFAEARLSREDGVSLFGPDLSQWDARVVDAQNVIESCRMAQHNAEWKATHPPQC